MQISGDGKFRMQIPGKSLAGGIRHFKTNPINNHALIEGSGIIGKDGLLQSIEQIISSFEMTETFPFPQIFVLTNLIIICTETDVYEVIDGSPVLQITVPDGDAWTQVNYHDFVYLSNGVTVVVRDPESKTYSETTDFPTATAACDFNGQVILGSPDAGYEIDN